MRLDHSRREYRSGTLLERSAPDDPLALFERWFALARRSPAEPHAMALATVSASGRPSVRMVLLKRSGPQGFDFFTNLGSRKAVELAARPAAALLFYWPEPHRQVRIEGRIVRVPSREADAYFAQRPRGAQIGAWASPQSRVLGSRRALEARVREVERRFARAEVPRPPHWGGFRLVPRVYEFWQGRENRLHDRLRYRKSAGTWRRVRLAP